MSDESVAELFSFGIITDTHIRDPAGDYSSPFNVNQLANDRAAKAIKTLAEQQPDFIIHLGDMVHPLPHLDGYSAACTHARDLFEDVDIPVYYTPGNHDIGDKPMPGSPAASINEEARLAYLREFGPDYRSFQYKDCVFIILNSSLWNSALRHEQQQLEWLQTELKKNKSKRKFIFSHYPHFVHDTAEAEHYDNIAEPARSSLLELFTKYNVEAVFSGHVHHFFFNRTDFCKHYVLPATSFVRQDYAELFKVPPVCEHGRDDPEKYGVAIVKITSKNHSLNLIPFLQQERLCPNSRKSTSLKVHLRHAWHESIDLPYNGPMEEFSRKRARNDYTLLRLWQLGITKVRIPISDLLDESILLRVNDYRSTGIQFHVFGNTTQFDQLANSQVANISDSFSFELISSNGTHPTLPDVYHDSAVSLGRATTGRAVGAKDNYYFHSVSSGFRWPIEANCKELILQWLTKRNHKSIVFLLPWESGLDVLHEINDWSQAHNCIAEINIRLATENPAQSNFDDAAIAHRLGQILQKWRNCSNFEFQLDTFVDIDRGFSPRHGLLDRLFNLRSTAIALQKSID